VGGGQSCPRAINDELRALAIPIFPDGFFGQGIIHPGFETECQPIDKILNICCRKNFLQSWETPTAMHQRRTVSSVFSTDRSIFNVNSLCCKKIEEALAF
jgi:hypothetical protein